MIRGSQPHVSIYSSSNLSAAKLLIEESLKVLLLRVPACFPSAPNVLCVSSHWPLGLVGT